MSEDCLNGSNKDRRSKRDRRSAPRFERSDEKKFLHGKVRFLHPSEIAEFFVRGYRRPRSEPYYLERKHRQAFWQRTTVRP